MSPRPHPILTRLGHALLRKAERSGGDRSVTLKLDAATLPELHQAATPEALAHLQLLLQGLCDTGWISLRLARAQAFQTWADRQPTLVLHDAAALAEWSGFVPDPPRWSRQLVQALRTQEQLQVPDAEALLDYLLRNPLPWFMERAPAQCAQTLNALAQACRSGQCAYLRELSARHFGGHSKVLDSRDELLRLLGASEGQFIEAPIHLLVSLPETASFREVLFIENLASFERMSRNRQSMWAEAALVYASGFKGAARRLRQRAGSSLYWRGGASPAETARFERWFYDGDAGTAAQASTLRISFFGDLDFAGMQILAQLRQGFPDCQAWRPGYSMLLAPLQSGHGHAPDQARKEGQSDPGLTGCEYADNVLLPALRQTDRCVDQEWWGWR